MALASISMTIHNNPLPIVFALASPLTGRAVTICQSVLNDFSVFEHPYVSLSAGAASGLTSSTHAKWRSKQNGRIMRPYWLCLKSPRRRSAIAQESLAIQLDGWYIYYSLSFDSSCAIESSLT